MIVRLLIGRCTSLVLSITLFHYATFCSAVEVSYGISFNNFIYDRLAVSDSLQQFYDIARLDDAPLDDAGPFEAAVKDTYEVDFEILKLSYVSRIEIKLTNLMNLNLQLDTFYYTHSRIY